MPQYDVAVIGAGMPGLTAAVLLARANRRVIVLDPYTEPGGSLVSCELEGLTFAAGPVIAHGFEPDGPLRLLHASLGLPLSTEMTSASYQVALPDRRITVHPDHSATLEELRREFPAEFDRVAAIYKDLLEGTRRHQASRTSSVLGRLRSAGSYLSARTVSPELLSFFDVQARFFFGLPVRRLSLKELSDLVAYAPLLLPQGFHGVAQQLRDQLSSVGGEFRGGMGWPELRTLSKGQMTLDVGTETITPKTVILNASWNADNTFFLGLQAGTVPVGMEDTVLCLPSYERPEDIFVLTLHGPEVLHQGSGGIRALTVSFLADDGPSALPEERRSRIGALVPFLESGIVVSGAPDQAERSYPFSGPWSHAMEGAADARQVRPVKGSRNLYLLHDRTHAVNLTVAAARRLAAKLAG